MFDPILGFGCCGNLDLSLLKLFLWKLKLFTATFNFRMSNSSSLLVMVITAISNVAIYGSQLFQRFTLLQSLGYLLGILTPSDGVMKKMEELAREA